MVIIASRSKIRTFLSFMAHFSQQFTYLWITQNSWLREIPSDMPLSPFRTSHTRRDHPCSPRPRWIVFLCASGIEREIEILTSSGKAHLGNGSMGKQLLSVAP